MKIYSMYSNFRNLLRNTTTYKKQCLSTAIIKLVRLKKNPERIQKNSKGQIMTKNDKSFIKEDTEWEKLTGHSFHIMTRIAVYLHGLQTHL